MRKIRQLSVSAVIVAAGKGLRAGGKNGQPKQFRKLAGAPLLAHSLKLFEACAQVNEIIVVAPENLLKRAEAVSEQFGISKAKIISGGKTRFDSVRRGFEQTDESSEIVVFHDAARPFAQIQNIARCVESALKFGAAITAIALEDSIKKTHVNPRSKKRFVEKTASRTDVWRAQTPQAFRRKLLAEIYSGFSGAPEKIEDEATLLEMAGVRAAVVAGQKSNIKITTEEDFIIGELIAKTIEM